MKEVNDKIIIKKKDLKARRVKKLRRRKRMAGSKEKN